MRYPAESIDPRCRLCGPRIRQTRSGFTDFVRRLPIVFTARREPTLTLLGQYKGHSLGEWEVRLLHGSLMGNKTHRAVSSQPEEGTIDVPHEPGSEAALLQETRERLAMLEGHLTKPEQVKRLMAADKCLEKLVANLSDCPIYECDCEERHEHF